MTASDPKVGASLVKAIMLRIGEARYRLWFERHTKLTWDESGVTVGVPNRHFEEWLQTTFRAVIESAAAEVFGKSVDVRFAIDPELFRATRQEQEEVKEASALGATPPDPQLRAPTATSNGAAKLTPAQPTNGCNGKPKQRTTQPPHLEKSRAKSTRRWHRLEDFVVSAGTRVAHASATSVVEMPDECGNPLVIHGSVGTGKTHLLEGVYVGLRKQRPNWRVNFVTAEQFTNRFVQAMRQSRLATFRRQFRECDVLLLDDLDFLATKKATQEEFLHTLDCLMVEGKPVVVSCDCHPRLTEELPPELIDRLLGGAVWGLTTPDEETRRTILKRKSVRKGVRPVRPEVLDYLAAQLRGNVRELEGALNSLLHFSRVTGKEIDVDLAREALADHLRHAVRVVQLRDVDEAVCTALRMSKGALQSNKRTWAVSHPRMLAMYLARKHTSAAYSEIGEYFGGRNHSTAVAAEKKVRKWLESNAELSFGLRALRVREFIEVVERDLSK